MQRLAGETDYSRLSCGSSDAKFLICPLMQQRRVCVPTEVTRWKQRQSSAECKSQAGHCKSSSYHKVGYEEQGTDLYTDRQSQSESSQDRPLVKTQKCGGNQSKDEKLDIAVVKFHDQVGQCRKDGEKLQTKGAHSKAENQRPAEKTEHPELERGPNDGSQSQRQESERNKKNQEHRRIAIDVRPSHAAFRTRYGSRSAQHLARAVMIDGKIHRAS